MEYQIRKQGRLIATSSSGRSTRVNVEGLPELICYSLPMVKIERAFVFEHLQGRPLTSIFDKAGLLISNGSGEPDVMEPVVLIHARSNALRGKVTISAVALIYATSQVDSREIATKAPEIYKKMSA